MREETAIGFWRRLVWGLLFPRTSRQRAEATPAGMVLIVVAFGLGMAAYNSANNILFITLSLLLGSLVMSGILSWANLRFVSAHFPQEERARAGEASQVRLQVSNGRRRLVALGLWLDWSVEPLESFPSVLSEDREVATGESGEGIRERLKRAEKRRLSTRSPVSVPVPAGAAADVVGTWIPVHRGPWLVKLESIGSMFPFGFLKKFNAVGREVLVLVRPAYLSYETHPLSPSGLEGGDGVRMARGEGPDLIGIRSYRTGDSPRQVHWKASARHGRLLVKESADERQESHVLILSMGKTRWENETQFEEAVRLTASLAQDLFHAGRLRVVMIEGETPVRLRTPADLEGWLDRLCCLRWGRETEEGGAGTVTQGGVGDMLVLPGMPGKAAVYIHGNLAYSPVGP